MDAPTRLARIEQMTSEIHKAVFGNGRPGLCDRMTVIEQRQEACPARRWSQPSILVALGGVLISATALVIAMR